MDEGLQEKIPLMEAEDIPNFQAEHEQLKALVADKTKSEENFLENVFERPVSKFKLQSSNFK